MKIIGTHKEIGYKVVHYLTEYDWSNSYHRCLVANLPKDGHIHTSQEWKDDNFGIDPNDYTWTIELIK